MRYVLAAICLALLATSVVSAQTTSFSYQGKLTLNGVPVDGLTDLRFTLYASQDAGAVVAGPYDVPDAQVTAGLVTARLNFAMPFDGNDRWLEVAVRPGISVGDYTLLTPRQQILSAPYALRARNVKGTGVEGPILLPQSTADGVAYGFAADPNTGMFSSGSNTLGLATTGVERIHVDGAGNVGIARLTNLLYKLTVADSNHQIALEDTDDSSVWTLTTISGGGFGVYQDGATQRLAINSSGTVTVEGGRAVVYGSNSSEQMMFRTTATLSASLSPGSGVDGTYNWGNQGFTSSPDVYVGDFIPGAAGFQDFDKFHVICHSVTATGCKVRITNLSSTTATIDGGKWSLLVIGPRS